jgi:hypothetical protein
LIQQATGITGDTISIMNKTKSIVNGKKKVSCVKKEKISNAKIGKNVNK